ncbi:ArsR/SmtB family transcription factor [Colwelliaceae bacterium 6471]
MALVQFFKCLADDTRLKILLLLNQESELCVCELTYALQMSQPKISRHIALLRQANIVEARPEGKWIYYRLSPQLNHWQKDAIEGCDLQHLYIKACSERLHNMGDRPKRKLLCCD